MKPQSIITADQLDGITYYETQRNGVAYTCHLTSDGEWCVHSHRLALGRHNVGTIRHYKNIDLLASSVKAFGQLPKLLQVPATAVFH